MALRALKAWPFWAYNLFFHLALPIVAAKLCIRWRQRGSLEGGWRERLGLMPEAAKALRRSGEPVVWVHAVSVGEVSAAASIIAALRCAAPLAQVILSTTTPTGRAEAERRGVDVDAMVYLPLDFPLAVWRALADVRPTVFCTIDSELWPNMISLAQARGTRVAVANARLSDRTMRAARALRFHFGWVLRNVDLVLAQSVGEAARFVELGAPRERVQVMGNSKFDEAFPEVGAAETAKLLQEMGLSREVPVLLAGSTREGEEAMLLEVLEGLRLSHQRLQLVVAPRHRERASEVVELVRARGYRPLLRTEQLGRREAGESAIRAEDHCEDCVVIVDTMGELARLYALAEVVFVGGSLVPWGGHNVLQPMAQAKPVVVGPYTHNFRDLVALALEAQAIVQVQNAEELREVIARLLGSPEERQLLGLRGLRVISENQGASVRAAEALADLAQVRGPAETEPAPEPAPAHPFA